LKGYAGCVYVGDATAMIEIIRDQSDENIVVARVATTVGTILVMAKVELRGRSLILSGVHIQATT
jgi:hypothetical protein